MARDECWELQRFRPHRRGLKSPPQSENPLKRVPQWALAHFRYEPRTLVLGGLGFGKLTSANLGFCLTGFRIIPS